ncbi:hypothetical protein DL98DRAFT_526041 [Cadophora sp. DSE1049]|nr:hypothetical protein DL98DRAFT_526041 [Cadophora sp. DSE1049]
MNDTRFSHGARRGGFYRRSYPPYHDIRRQPTGSRDTSSSVPTTFRRSADGVSAPASRSWHPIRHKFSRQLLPPNDHHTILSVEQTKDLLGKKPKARETRYWEWTARLRVRTGQRIPIFVAKAQMSSWEASRVRQSIWTQDFLKSMNILPMSSGSSSDAGAEQRGNLAAVKDSNGKAEVELDLSEKETPDRLSGDEEKMEVECGGQRMDQDMDMLDIAEDNSW